MSNPYKNFQKIFLGACPDDPNKKKQINKLTIKQTNKKIDFKYIRQIKSDLHKIFWVTS